MYKHNPVLCSVSDIHKKSYHSRLVNLKFKNIKHVSAHTHASLGSIIKANRSTCIDIDGELLNNDRCTEPETRSPVTEVHSARLSVFKLSQKPLLQLLLCALPQGHVRPVTAARSRLGSLFEAADQAEELLLLCRAVELGGGPLAKTLRGHTHTHVI